MKKTLMLLLIFISIQITAQEQSKNVQDMLHDTYAGVYAGYRRGQFVVGQQLRLEVQDRLSFNFDIATDVNISDTSGGFDPQLVDFGIGVRYENIGIEHHSLHAVDQENTFWENDQNLYNRFIYDWFY